MKDAKIFSIDSEEYQGLTDYLDSQGQSGSIVYYYSKMMVTNTVMVLYTSLRDEDLSLLKIKFSSISFEESK